MDNQQVASSEIGWLAGFFDGEGYIGLRVEYHKGMDKVYIRPEMNMGNTDQAMTEKAVDIARRMGTNLHIRKAALKKRKEKWFWVAQTRSQAKISRLFTQLMPYLTGRKQERTRLVVEFCDSRMNQKAIDRHLELKIPGLKGNGHNKPYTDHQLNIFEQVQPMMRKGPRTSETIRAMRRRNSKLLEAVRAQRQEVENDLGMTIEEYLSL